MLEGLNVPEHPLFKGHSCGASWVWISLLLERVGEECGERVEGQEEKFGGKGRDTHPKFEGIG